MPRTPVATAASAAHRPSAAHPAAHPAKAGPDAAPLPTDVPASPVEPSQVQVMNQARQDLAAGQVDTDMHATPGLDAQRRATLVPGPGGQQPAAPASKAVQPASTASASKPSALPTALHRGSKPGQ